jgi:hypothetical protein
MAPRRSVELRGEVPRDLIDVIDAVALARGVTRIDLVQQILSRWARERVHEANVIHRVTGGNPPLSESNGSRSD